MEPLNGSTTEFIRVCRHEDLSVAGIIGICVGIGVPVLVCCILVVYCSERSRRMNTFRKLSSFQRFQLSGGTEEKLAKVLRVNTKWDRIRKIVPDERMRLDIERCTFKQEVIDFVAALSHEDRVLIYEHITSLHGKAKTAELCNFVSPDGVPVCITVIN